MELAGPTSALETKYLCAESKKGSKWRGEGVVGVRGGWGWVGWRGAEGGMFRAWLGKERTWRMVIRIGSLEKEGGCRGRVGEWKWGGGVGGVSEEEVGNGVGGGGGGGEGS